MNDFPVVASAPRVPVAMALSARVYSFELVGSSVARPLGLVLVTGGSSLPSLLSPDVRRLECRGSDLPDQVALT